MPSTTFIFKFIIFCVISSSKVRSNITYLCLIDVILYNGKKHMNRFLAERVLGRVLVSLVKVPNFVLGIFSNV